MTFLPIVERELRVAARRPGTYWTRSFSALGLIAVWLLVVFANGGTSAAHLSQILLVVFGILALGFCLFAGIFLTADCLSEEKREGTLGLLFLTDLRGYDVVFGKLIATSVHSVYGLLAIFPVLALPLLMGGVTGGEFWRLVLVLMATLFLSLSLGMAVSALAREARQAMAGTFLGMLVLAGVLPALWWLGLLVFRSRPSGVLLWSSPVCAFWATFDATYRGSIGRHQFWMSLLTVSLLGLGLLVLAAVLLPRAWQSRARDAREGWAAAKPSGQGAGLSVERQARLTKSLEANPYRWLASHARSPNIPAGIILALLVLVWFCFLAASVALANGSRDMFPMSLFTAFALHLVGKYLAAVEATRQLGEDRRSGALELLLVTPLKETQILSGQRLALKRHSVRLKMLLVCVNLCLCVAVLVHPRHMPIGSREQAGFVELFLGGIIMVFVDFNAIQTVGMWMALRARSQQRAILATLAALVLVPWMAMFLLWVLAIAGTLRLSEGGVSAIFALWFVGGIVNDLFFSAQARAALGRGLRYWVAERNTPGDREPFKALEPSIPRALNA